jgi:hypothetical protein
VRGGRGQIKSAGTSRVTAAKRQGANQARRIKGLFNSHNYPEKQVFNSF